MCVKRVDWNLLGLPVQNGLHIKLIFHALLPQSFRNSTFPCRQGVLENVILIILAVERSCDKGTKCLLCSRFHLNMKLGHFNGIYENGPLQPHHHPQVGIECIWNGFNIKLHLSLMLYIKS